MSPTVTGASDESGGEHTPTTERFKWDWTFTSDYCGSVSNSPIQSDAKISEIDSYTTDAAGGSNVVISASRLSDGSLTNQLGIIQNTQHIIYIYNYTHYILLTPLTLLVYLYIHSNISFTG